MRVCGEAEGGVGATLPHSGHLRVGRSERSYLQVGQSMGVGRLAQEVLLCIDLDCVYADDKDCSDDRSDENCHKTYLQDVHQSEFSVGYVGCYVWVESLATFWTDRGG